MTVPFSFGRYSKRLVEAGSRHCRKKSMKARRDEILAMLG